MKTPILILCFCAALGAQAAWYWPFGTDRDGTNAPPRLHRLLQPANDFIELAQDASLDGDTVKALENYRLALAELDRVEVENPDRAASAEFAPLRLRRAACTAAMDAIRFAQVNENVRPVSVTDTTELQKRWDKDHGLVVEEDEAKKPAAPPPQEGKKPAAPPPQEAKKPAAPSPREEVKPKPAVKEATKPEEDWKGRIAQAMADLRAQDYAAADVLLESMLKERPKDLNALLMRAAAQAGTQSYNAAQRTLERAMRAHPRSFLPYYNLANLLAQHGGDLEAAREYYELGRTVGGPVNKALEAKLKGGSK